MAIDRVGYRALRREPSPGLHGLIAIWRWNLWLLVRRPFFLCLVGIGLLHFLLHFALIYIKAQITVLRPGMAKLMDQYLVTGEGTAYRDFLKYQTTGIMVLLAYAGVVMVVSDYRAGGLTFYLSKPVGAFHYVLGKLLALSTIVGMLTLAPALGLFVEYGLFANSVDYWFENPRIIVGIIGASLLIMIVPSLLLLALGSVCRKPAPLLLVWCAIFVVAPIFSELLREVFKERDWRMLNLWQSISILGEVCFGSVTFASERPYISASAMIVGCVLVGSTLVLGWKLKAVEVVG